MGLSNKGKQQQSARDNRRAWVARLALRGRTQREIASDLATQGVSVNPDTGEAWTFVTIGNDLRALRQQWREDAAQTIAEHQALMIAELEEVRRRAWSDGNLPVVLRALQQKAKLLGLDAPAKIAPTDPTGEKPYDPIGPDTRKEILGRLLRINARAGTGKVDGKPEPRGSG